METLSDQYAPLMLGEMKFHKWVNMALERLAWPQDVHDIMLVGPEGAGCRTRARAFIRACLSAFEKGDQKRVRDSCKLSLERLCGVDMVTSKVHIEVNMNSIRDQAQLCDLVMVRSRVCSMVQRNDYPTTFVFTNAQSMDPDMQAALRRIMEDSRVRFILCSTHANLLDAIKSRCIKFFLPYPSVGEIKAELKTIVKSAKLVPSPGMIDQVSQLCGGKFRVALARIESMCVVADRLIAPNTTSCDYPWGLAKLTSGVQVQDLQMLLFTKVDMNTVMIIREKVQTSIAFCPDLRVLLRMYYLALARIVDVTPLIVTLEHRMHARPHPIHIEALILGAAMLVKK